jgi:hypothetical protein
MNNLLKRLMVVLAVVTIVQSGSIKANSIRDYWRYKISSAPGSTLVGGFAGLCAGVTVAGDFIDKTELLISKDFLNLDKKPMTFLVLSTAMIAATTGAGA